MQDANMKKAPSVRELPEKRTEGEKFALFKTLDKGNALSPTRFAGPLTRPDPSVASRHLPALRGVTPLGEPMHFSETVCRCRGIGGGQPPDQPLLNS